MRVQLAVRRGGAELMFTFDRATYSAREGEPVKFDIRGELKQTHCIHDEGPSEVDLLWEFIDSLRMETTVPRQDSSPDILVCDPEPLKRAKRARKIREGGES